jgi:ABC-type dipeptide/oligopeptide/nickel transport system permease component
MVLDGVKARDFPVVQGRVITTAIFSIVISLLVASSSIAASAARRWPRRSRG